MRSIVLGSTRYADDAFIVDLYTEETGITTVAVKTGKKSRVRMCHIQPLTILDVTLTGKPTRSIQHIRECAVEVSLASTQNPTKILTAQFLAEVLRKILRNAPQDAALFNFIHTSLIRFSTLQRGEANFHLFLLIKLTHFLGIYPNTEAWASGSLFDMDSGAFVSVAPTHGYFLTQSDTVNFANMLRTNYDNMHCWQITRTQRNQILEHIIEYYRIHAIDIGHAKTLDILRIL